MIAARVTIASYRHARFSYRVATRRHRFSRFTHRSTTLRSRYNAASNRYRTRSCRRCGIIARIPHRRACLRIAPLPYPLSPTTQRGRWRGLPRPRRCTAPPAISAGQTGHSCRCPAVTTQAIGSPLRSQRRCSFVPQPPRLLPNPSSPPLFLLPLHVGVHGCSCYPRNAPPNRAAPQRPLAVARRRRCPPIRPAAASG